MITKEQARQLVVFQVCERPDWLPPEDEIVVVDDATMEKSWGWVFFYTSKKWQETRETKYALAGNAPLIVERDGGKIVSTGTAKPIDSYIANYERCGNPHG